MRHYVDLQDDDYLDLINLPHRLEQRSAGDEIVREGELVDFVFFIERGWAIRYRLLDDGRRQILNFMLPGDCFDLMSVANVASDHSVAAASDVEMRRINNRDFLRTLTERPRLATAFWWAAVQEEGILREQIVRNGRRSAKERVGHLILELNRRVTAHTGVPSNELEMPVPQSLFADVLGLSAVHVSRTFSKLRAAGLIRTSIQGITILDRARLELLSDFDPKYLHLQRINLLPD